MDELTTLAPVVPTTADSDGHLWGAVHSPGSFTYYLDVDNLRVLRLKAVSAPRDLHVNQRCSRCKGHRVVTFKQTRSKVHGPHHEVFDHEVMIPAGKPCPGKP